MTESTPKPERSSCVSHHPEIMNTKGWFPTWAVVGEGTYSQKQTPVFRQKGHQDVGVWSLLATAGSQKNKSPGTQNIDPGTVRGGQAQDMGRPFDDFPVSPSDSPLPGPLRFRVSCCYIEVLKVEKGYATGPTTWGRIYSQNIQLCFCTEDKPGSGPRSVCGVFPGG